MKQVNLYFDTEFTGLHKNTELISIGIVTDDGRSFYAELSDFNVEKAKRDAFLRDNVLANLLLLKNGDWKACERALVKAGDIADIVVLGDKRNVALELKSWLKSLDDTGKTIFQPVSDVCHYDMVLLIDIFGGAFDLPKNIAPVCHDINADLARIFAITEYAAFDFNREEALQKLYGEIPDGAKHNSLYDAKVIQRLHKKIIEWEDNDL